MKFERNPRYRNEWRYDSAPDGKLIRVTVFYDIGGMNLFTYRRERRGVYVSVTPMEKHGGMIIFTAFSGSKLFIFECKALSPLKLRCAAEEIDPVVEEVAKLYQEGRKEEAFAKLSGPIQKLKEVFGDADTVGNSGPAPVR